MTKNPLAYEAYEKLADHYASMIDTKPHNAYYDRPAMLKMLPDVRGKRVLDAGCGPGAYAETLVSRGADVVAFDVSDRMLELARTRLKDTVDLRRIDMTQPLTMFADEEFDLVNAPLCLDYIEDWTSLFGEFRRVLKPGGCLVYSCGHPSFDAKYFNTSSYFSVEQVQSVWTGFGIDVTVPCYRRSLEECLMPVVRSGMNIDLVHEPQPTEDFKAADLRRYLQLMHRPSFIMVRALKPSKANGS
jgi:SAM-dependent methyltransferase